MRDVIGVVGVLKRGIVGVTSKPSSGKFKGQDVSSYFLFLLFRKRTSEVQPVCAKVHDHDVDIFELEEVLVVDFEQAREEMFCGLYFEVDPWSRRRYFACCI